MQCQEWPGRGLQSTDRLSTTETEQLINVVQGMTQ